MSDAQLDNEDTLQLLKRLASAGVELIVVGGQAVNHWAERYMRLGSAEDLAAGAPYASKDVDLFGTVETVKACALALDGRHSIPERGHETPDTGCVFYRDSTSAERRLDFLGNLYGLDHKDDVRRMSIAFAQPTDEGGEVRFRVMHPYHCLKSRVSNVGGLAGYQSEHALNQLRASIICMREFLRELLDSGETRAVMKLTERIFELSWWSINARKVYLNHGIETADAALHDDPRLPERFRTERFPRVRAQIAERRRRAARRMLGS